MVAHLIITHYLIITHLVHITHKPDILHDPDITFTFILGCIHAVKHNLNPCQPPYPIMYQNFAMEAQAGATRCCIIVILLVQLSLEEWGVIRATWGHYLSQYQHCHRFPKNVCWNDTRPSMCHHQSFLMDDCTTKQLEIDKKWVFSIFYAILTLKWPWCDLDMTLVLSTSKAQLLLMLLFAHKLRSCWCFHTNLTLQNILLFFTPPPLPPRNSEV